MTRQRLTGTRRVIVRGTSLLGFPLVVVAAALAYMGYSHRPQEPTRARAPFVMAARPAARSVSRGHRVWYRITFVRHTYRGPIKVTVAKAATVASAYPSRRAPGRLTLKSRAQSVTLAVSSNATDPLGRYLIRLMARGGRYRTYLTVRLTIQAAPPAPFTVTGNAGQLWPGVSKPINLSLTNPNGQAISVNRLTVSVQTVDAPRATAALRCSAADFSVTQVSAPYPLTVPAHATRLLSDLGVAAAQQPQVTLLDRPVDQDGCPGARVTLRYGGSATGQ